MPPHSKVLRQYCNVRCNIILRRLKFNCIDTDDDRKLESVLD